MGESLYCGDKPCAALRYAIRRLMPTKAPDGASRDGDIALAVWDRGVEEGYDLSILNLKYCPFCGVRLWDSYKIREWVARWKA